MDFCFNLAQTFFETHPVESAKLLEAHTIEVDTDFMEKLSSEVSAKVFELTTPYLAATILEKMDILVIAKILQRMSPDFSSIILRKISVKKRKLVLKDLPPELSENLKLSLSFPLRTAGALMDPSALSVPQDITVKEFRQIHRKAHGKYQYFVYITDRERKLMGILNLKELNEAHEDRQLSYLLGSEPVSLPSSADYISIIKHPGWELFYAMPVVDDSNRFLGILHYKATRSILKELSKEKGKDLLDQLGNSLGQIMQKTLGGIIEGLEEDFSRRDDQ